MMSSTGISFMNKLTGLFKGDPDVHIRMRPDGIYIVSQSTFKEIWRLWNNRNTGSDCAKFPLMLVKWSTFRNLAYGHIIRSW